MNNINNLNLTLSLKRHETSVTLGVSGRGGEAEPEVVISLRLNVICQIENQNFTK